MAMNLVKSAWESGVLTFRNRATNAKIFAIGPERVRQYYTAADLDAQNGTLTAAQIVGGILVHTSVTGAGTLTTDTAAAIIAAFPGMEAGDAVECRVINDGTQVVTIAGGTSVTIADAGQTIGADESALLLFVCNSATTMTVYTVGA